MKTYTRKWRISMPHGARLRAEHYRDKAAQFRELAEIEHLPSLCQGAYRVAKMTPRRCEITLTLG